LAAARRRMARRAVPALRQGPRTSGTRQGQCCTRNP
jgi:hypothetical protein